MAESCRQSHFNLFVDAARKARKASGINPDEAIALRIRDTMKQKEANSERHREDMRKLTEQMSELRPKPVVSLPSSRNELAGTEREAASTTAPASENKKRRISLSAKSGNGHEKKAKVKAHVEQTKETERASEQYTTLANLPLWYNSISINSQPMRDLSKKRPPALATLDALKALVQQCEATKNSRDLPNLYDKLRDCIHKAEITLPVTRHIIRKANMLHPQFGLPRIFTANFPADIKADSYQLYKRWSTGDMTQSLLRGIVTKKSHSRASDRIDPGYRLEFPNPAKYIGQGTLVQGQWWPTQLCAVRDGAHGESQGGICGSSDEGAYSIVLSSGTGYEDADAGDTILYSGTSGKEGVASENTKSLLTSHETGLPVRVLRSAQLPKENPYRPEKGLRYDGLYTVVDFEVLDKDKAEYRFRLERCGGQMEIRYRGKAKRPTVYEVREYERLKEDGAWEMMVGGSG